MNGARAQLDTALRPIEEAIRAREMGLVFCQQQYDLRGNSLCAPSTPPVRPAAKGIRGAMMRLNGRRG